MSEPREVLTQLLSDSQAEVLSTGAASMWETTASAISTILGSPPSIQELDGRLVMPDEIAGEFEEPHLVTPLNITTDQDQSATAYLVLNTDIAAMFFDSQADEPGDQEQQTIIMASAVLGQLVSAINTSMFSDSPNGLVVALEDMTASTMPALLKTMEEPGLLMTGTVQGERILPLSLFLPGTFLDILSVSFPAEEEEPDAEPAAEVEVEAEPAPALLDADTPLTLSLEDLEEADIATAPPLPEGPAALPEEVDAESPPVLEPVAAAPAREPTPISQAAVHRASFTPFGEQPASATRSNMGLLAGLDMSVTVELGRADMSVSEVLSLGAGSVIELDRLSGEPVDVLVNGRIIAHGEVVVVDENFGVRVVEIAKPKLDAGEAR